MKQIVKKLPILYNSVKKVLIKYNNIHNYYRIKRSLKTNTSIKIVIGASGIFQDKWIPTDIDYMNIIKKKHCENLRQSLLIFQEIVRNSEISFIYDMPDDVGLRSSLSDIIDDINLTILCLNPSRITRVGFEAIIMVKR